MHVSMLAALNEVLCNPGCFVTNDGLVLGPPASTSDTGVRGVGGGALHDHGALDASGSTYSQE